MARNVEYTMAVLEYRVWKEVHLDLMLTYL